MNLGFPLAPGVWAITVHAQDGRKVTCAFTKEQAIKIAERIVAHYADCPDGLAEAAKILSQGE